ncbi:MAG: YeeE/YedE family protein [Betaproteobacteria bacterium]|nr:YeeE/YedE family protein [Betaproteobacteria bacterium]
MTFLTAALSGVIFGIGLLLSGMANPAKVQGFLDLAGHWDPSLAMVMIGAIAVGVVGFAIAKRQAHSLLKLPMQLPAASKVDRKLLVGSALFGIGWGLAGVCPGPALVSLSMGIPQAIVFVVAMLAGMQLLRFIQK